MNRDELVARLETPTHENIRLKPYVDTAGKVTLGIGRNLTDVGITAAEARVLCLNDVIGAENDLDYHIAWWRNMDDVRQQILCEMCFNMGLPRLAKFQKMLGYLQVGNTSGAAEEMLNSQWATEVKDRAKVLATAMKTGSF